MGVVHGVGGASEERRYQTNLSTASNASNMLERDSFRLELFKQNIKCLKCQRQNIQNTPTHLTLISYHSMHILTPYITLLVNTQCQHSHDIT